MYPNQIEELLKTYKDILQKKVEIQLSKTEADEIRKEKNNLKKKGAEISHIVVVVIHDENRLLFVKHKSGSGWPNKWVFPGGKVKSSESFEQAAKREIREELNVNIEIEDCVLICEYLKQYENKLICKEYIVFFNAKIVKPSEVKPGREIQEIKMFKPSEIDIKELVFPEEFKMLETILNLS